MHAGAWVIPVQVAYCRIYAHAATTGRAPRTACALAGNRAELRLSRLAADQPKELRLDIHLKRFERPFVYLPTLSASDLTMSAIDASKDNADGVHSSSF